MQAYEGYFENGQFYATGNIIRIQGRKRAIINILEDEVIETKTKSQKQGEALEKFFADVKEIDDEPLDEEFFAIINSGVRIDSGVDL